MIVICLLIVISNYPYFAFLVNGRGIFVNGKRYRPADAFGSKSGRPWLNGPLGGKFVN